MSNQRFFKKDYLYWTKNVNTMVTKWLIPNCDQRSKIVRVQLVTEKMNFFTLLMAKW